MVEAVTPREVVENTVEVLGLDPSIVDLTNPEVLAASVRRAASFLCPITPRLLIRSVDEVLAGLPGHEEETRTLLETTVEAALLYGDLLELPVEDESGRRRHLYLGPPAFVQRQSGVMLLMGVRPDGAPLISSEISEWIEYDGHIRLLRPTSQVTTEELLDDGLIELQPDQWLQSPSPEAPDVLVDKYNTRVLATGDTGPLEGVRVLDPARPTTYYQGRWRHLTSDDTGTFVARRPQEYGADLWCYLEVRDGTVQRGLDFPLREPLRPGSDEAWRLQAALDAASGHPQRVAVRDASRTGWSVIHLFSPIPSWAQRRLDVAGTPLPRSQGALISYAVPTAEVSEEIEFLETMMWLSTVEGETSSDD